MNTTFDSNIAALLAHELDPAFAARAALILRHVQPAGAGRILDVGCGRGFYTRAIAALYPQAAVVGVDYSKDYLTAAAEHTRGMAVQFARADARSLPFESGEFDAIVCSEVLEHIVEDGAVLMELARVLRNDGLLLISVPNRQYPFMWDPLNWMLERVFGTHVPSHIWWLAGIWADHVRLYTAPELSRRVRSAGFTLDNLWLTTPRCMPFAHFLLYGIGKNIIERGFLPSCNRFDQEQGDSRLLRWARSLLFAFDDPPKGGTDESFSVGIVLKARKLGCAAKIAQE